MKFLLQKQVSKTIKHLTGLIAACIYLSGLNAQEIPNNALQDDSITLRQIDPGDIFHGKIIDISNEVDKKKLKKNLRKLPDNKSWRFSLNAGADFQIAPNPADIPDELNKYRNGLRLGARFGTNTVFFASPNVGFGINYSLFNTNNKAQHLPYTVSEGIMSHYSREDKVNVHFFGPSLSIRSIPKANKIYALCEFTLGYSLYNNNLRVDRNTYNLESGNFGFASSIGFDFLLNKTMSIGIILNITAASIEKVIPDDIKTKLAYEEERENLSRVGLILSLRAYK
ncbi:MAG: hypothetical protein LBR10_07175 [Prevotellaceae bacterium]|jgi:hypothetical protein|nr:hypothetical protein [Prevotellaceae bacterium]